jgi:hypothetical protein
MPSRYFPSQFPFYRSPWGPQDPEDETPLDMTAEEIEQAIQDQEDDRVMDYLDRLNNP